MKIIEEGLGGVSERSEFSTVSSIIEFRVLQITEGVASKHHKPKRFAYYFTNQVNP